MIDKLHKYKTCKKTLSRHFCKCIQAEFRSFIIITTNNIWANKYNILNTQ